MQCALSVAVCKRKIGILDEVVNKCKCGHVFCTLHREPEVHACTFDWKKYQSDKLKQQLCTADRDKTNKI
jgi:predicted nucleic acid binding AN1-type Zn finger protein